jgi:hypothetical protein
MKKETVGRPEKGGAIDGFEGIKGCFPPSSCARRHNFSINPLYTWDFLQWQG